MTSVKFFHSAMAGAPTLSGTAGTLINVLDACLVNGFGLKTVDTLSVAGNVATVTISTGHIFEADSVVLIAGATPAELNGQKRVITSTATTITFAAPGVANQNATGTITAILAPAGWAKSFSGTNLAAYRSADITSTQEFLRVDDTGTVNARVVGYENMTDINTGTGPFPTAAQVSGGAFWPKANAANATARGWTVIADSKCFYLHLHTATASLGASGIIVGFGDFNSYKAGDTFGAFLFAPNIDVSTQSANGQTYCLTAASTTSNTWTPRSFTALGSSIAMGIGVESYGVTSGNSGGANATLVPVYPNTPNNAMVLSRRLIYEPSVCLRGVFKGILHSVQNLHTQFQWRDTVTGQGDFANRRLLCIKGSGPAATTSAAAVFFDITGPWE